MSAGSCRIISKTGREEKKVEASTVAAILDLKWNHDGTALATAGEDGAVKVWSRSGMLRSTMATLGTCNYKVVGMHSVLDRTSPPTLAPSLSCGSVPALHT